MNDFASPPPEQIRLVFQLERCDNPRLYDDLIRFKKGTKRVNRLRTLAHDGLLVQHGVVGITTRAAWREHEATPRDMDEASITSQAFDEPLSE